jgi:hypothetical protein
MVIIVAYFRFILKPNSFVVRANRFPDQSNHNWQQNVYRVDYSTGVPDIAVESFVRHLEEWKGDIPCDVRQHSADNASIKKNVYSGHRWYLKHYSATLCFWRSAIGTSSEKW